MKINVFFFIAIMNCSFVGHGQPRKELLVRRYNTSDYGGTYSSPITVLIEKRKYSVNQELIYKVEYKSKLFFDSTQYRYTNGKLVKLTEFTNFITGDNTVKKTEDISFIYKNGNLSYLKKNNKIIEITESEKEEYCPDYLETNKIFALKDSLGILDKEFGDLNLPGLKSIRTCNINNKLKKKSYTGDYLPNILFEYGIPHNTYLERINIYYTKDKLIRKDEFLYDDVTVLRKYQYSNHLIKNIRVSVFDNYKKLIRSDLISFIYKYE